MYVYADVKDYFCVHMCARGCVHVCTEGLHMCTCLCLLHVPMFACKSVYVCASSVEVRSKVPKLSCVLPFRLSSFPWYRSSSKGFPLVLPLGRSPTVASWRCVACVSERQLRCHLCWICGGVFCILRFVRNLIPGLECCC